MPVTLEPCGVVPHAGVVVTQIPVTLEPCGVVTRAGGVVVTSGACHVRAVWGRPVLWWYGGYVR